MDVQDVAPALLALEDIVQIANRKFNGGSAGIRVLVNADVEQKVFQIGLRLGCAGHCQRLHRIEAPVRIATMA